MKYWPFGNHAAPAPERREPSVTRISNEMSLADMTSWNDLLDGVTSSHAGIPISRDMAMRSSAVFASVQLLSGLLAILPLPIFERGENNDRNEARDHPIWKLLNSEPSATLFPALFKTQIMEHRLLDGDYIARIERNRLGDPLALHPAVPRMTVVDKKNGRLIYVMTDDEGRVWTLDQDDVLHIPSVGFNGKKSMTPLQYAARSGIAIQLAADEFTEKFFNDGVFSNVSVEYPAGMNDEQLEAVTAYWRKKRQGRANMHDPILTTEGGKVVPLNLNASDAQLIESRNFQIHDIARVYGVPPHLIGATDKTTSWGTGIEQQTLGFIMFTLQRHLVFIEQEINRKLIRDPKYFAEFNVEGILRGDSKARSEFYRAALGGPGSGAGWMTPGEVRRKENLPVSDDPSAGTLFDPNKPSEAKNAK